MSLKNDQKLAGASSYLMLMTKIILVIGLMFITTSCGVGVQYSMTGSTTTAKNISITEFYNNSDLGPANMGQTLSNQLKTYFIQNSNLSVVPADGELQLEGEINGFTLSPIAPVSTGNPADLNQAALTRLTITVKVTYINTLEEKMSFKDRNFSFYKDFPNDQNIADVQDQYTREIFNRIINDIFNASVANW
jgi:hypothetical protein